MIPWEKRSSATGSAPSRVAPSGADLHAYFEAPAAPEDPLLWEPTRLQPEVPEQLFLMPRLPSLPPQSQRAQSAAGLSIGSIVDKYRVDEVLGVGGFAVVYRATHLILRREVALKVIRSRLLEERPHLAALLCEEARIAAKIDDRRVVRVFDVTHNEQITYVVMELVPGETIATEIRRQRRLPVRLALRMALDVVGGLRAALEQGVIHRDIKPQNILLARDGTAKILDLGLALSTIDRRGVAVRRTGPTVVGTYGYMAPEQLRDPEHVDCRADMYSLGATLYHAITGAPPFPTDDPGRCADLHANAPVPPPELRLPGLDGDVSRLVCALLEKRPSARPGSYGELEAMLMSLLSKIETNIDERAD